MLYENTNKKFVTVFNKKIPFSVLANASTHIMAGLIAAHPDINEMEFLNYSNKDSLKSTISRHPSIILTAKNSNQLRVLREYADEIKIPNNSFVRTMLGNSSEDQLQQTLDSDDANMEYIAISLFGNSEELNPITKKFSLFKG
jgi:hypothetical protein